MMEMMNAYRLERVRHRKDLRAAPMRLRQSVPTRLATGRSLRSKDGSGGDQTRLEASAVGG